MATECVGEIPVTPPQSSTVKITTCALNCDVQSCAMQSFAVLSCVVVLNVLCELFSTAACTVASRLPTAALPFDTHVDTHVDLHI